MRFLLPALVVLTVLYPVAARAQSGADVTLQLPSFHSVGVNTTVLVPDRGPSALARERQAFYERAMYGGVPTQRTIGLGRRNASLQTTAQIHDLRAADAAVLREARERRATWKRGSVDARGAGQWAAEPPVPLRSVADIEQARAAEAAAKARESQQFLELARQAYREGKSGVAAVYYGMASSRADSKSKLEIDAEARNAKTAATLPAQTASGRR